MRKTTSLSLILAAALGLSSLAVAGTGGPRQHGWHGHGHAPHGMGMMARGFAKLDLSDAQKASIQQIMQASLQQNRSERQALRTQREAFARMTPDQVGYQAAAARLAQAEGDATRQRIEQRAKVRAQVYALLTASQKAKLQALHSEREARRAQWQQFKATHPAPAASSAR